MHHSRLCAVLIDCKTADVDEAAHFWAAALGRPVDLGHPMSRDNYRMLATPPDEPIVEIQRVEHESRVLDIETDDIPAEVRRLERLGATVDRPGRWVVMQAPTGQRFCVVRVQRPGFPKNANPGIRTCLLCSCGTTRARQSVESRSVDWGEADLMRAR
jgi:hypothetical protein